VQEGHPIVKCSLVLRGKCQGSHLLFKAIRGKIWMWRNRPTRATLEKWTLKLNDNDDDDD